MTPKPLHVSDLGTAGAGLAASAATDTALRRAVQVVEAECDRMATAALDVPAARKGVAFARVVGARQALGVVRDLLHEIPAEQTAEKCASCWRRVIVRHRVGIIGGPGVRWVCAGCLQREHDAALATLRELRGGAGCG